MICSLVASEIVQDGDTFQMGTGTVSAALAPFLSHRHDLGVHSELIFGGIPALVEQGVVTGARKTVHPGKVVGASFGPLIAEEFAAVDGDLRYELYCMSHTNDIAVIAAHENMCAVNNALLVDADGADQRRDASGRRSTAARAAPSRSPSARCTRRTGAA